MCIGWLERDAAALSGVEVVAAALSGSEGVAVSVRGVRPRAREDAALPVADISKNNQRVAMMLKRVPTISNMFRNETGKETCSRKSLGDAGTTIGGASRSTDCWSLCDDVSRLIIVLIGISLLAPWIDTARIAQDEPGSSVAQPRPARQAAAIRS